MSGMSLPHNDPAPYPSGILDHVVSRSIEIRCEMRDLRISFTPTQLRAAPAERCATLLARVPHTATRRRDGALEEVSLDEIVPCDLVLIRQGDVWGRRQARRAYSRAHSAYAKNLVPWSVVSRPLERRSTNRCPRKSAFVNGDVPRPKSHLLGSPLGKAGTWPRVCFRACLRRVADRA